MVTAFRWCRSKGLLSIFSCIRYILFGIVTILEGSSDLRLIYQGFLFNGVSLFGTVTLTSLNLYLLIQSWTKWSSQYWTDLLIEHEP